MLIPFTYQWIIKKHIYGIAILDVGAGNGDLMSLLNKNNEYNVTGIELWDSYINKANMKGCYRRIIKKDVRKFNYENKSFDTVLLSQVIEHLTKIDGKKLLTKLEKTTIKRIIIGTPNGHFHRHDCYDGNPLQDHQSGWNILDLRQRGYKIHGQGLKLIYDQQGLLKYPIFNDSFLKYPLFIIGILCSPLVYYFPQLGAHIIAIKTKNI